jgi:leucyl/phenylalanyl-tRNA---protein transferase
LTVKAWDRENDVPWVPPEYADEHGLVGVGGSLSPTYLIRAYAEGVFPWFGEGDPFLWWSPNPRAIFDVRSGLHISRRLARTYRSGKFQVTFNHAFGQVIRACGDRPEGTWITSDMVAAYEELHRLRVAHSVEAWQDGELAGGIYGVSINAFFAAESMFFRRTDASKVAMVAMFERLREKGFELVDTQMLTEHTERLGAFEVTREHYLDLLNAAIEKEGVRF